MDLDGLTLNIRLVPLLRVVTRATTASNQTALVDYRAIQSHGYAQVRIWRVNLRWFVYLLPPDPCRTRHNVRRPCCRTQEHYHRRAGWRAQRQARIESRPLQALLLWRKIGTCH